jgi:hypothetical protein
MTIEEFVVMVCQRDLPVSPMGRVKTLARELAEGALNEVWKTIFTTKYGKKNDSTKERDGSWFTNTVLQTYLLKRWNDYYPEVNLLIRMGYLDRLEEGVGTVGLTNLAFKLVKDVVPATIFISYKRTESSALALLVAEKLKNAGLHPFIDMALIPGEDWEAGLKDRIEKSDYLLLLLSNETLKSEVTLKEIGWAMDAGVKVIPIWHNGFSYKSGTWGNIPVRIDELLTKTHTIRVLEENPLAYNTAMTELLNRFGIMP